MKPVKQSLRHDPAAGINGDCYRAVIASIFELELEAVPHFAHDGADFITVRRRVSDWLRTRGYFQFSAAFGDSLDRVFEYVATINPGVPYILNGASRSGCNHAVVCLDGRIIHDPSIDGAGIVGPCNDGLYWLTYFGVDPGSANRRNT